MRYLLLILLLGQMALCSCSKKDEGTPDVPKSILTTQDTIVLRGQYYSLYATIEGLPDTVRFSYETSDPDVLFINDSGLAVARNAGMAIVKVSAENYDVAAAEYEVTVAVDKIDMQSIPSGQFLMGSSDGTNQGDADGSGINVTPEETYRESDEYQHKVRISEFRMGTYEVTNRQFCDFLNSVCADDLGRSGSVSKYPYLFLVKADKSAGCIWDRHRGIWCPVSGRDNCPAVSVTWYGAYEYAAWCGMSLPTEAQWEYACRAGSQSQYFWGESSDMYDKYSVALVNGLDMPSEVGQKMPNGYRLYDMTGNVMEWCSDWYGPKFGYDLSEVSEDPVGPDFETEVKVLRGGSFLSQSVAELRSANRDNLRPAASLVYVGFRVVENIEK